MPNTGGVGVFSGRGRDFSLKMFLAQIAEEKFTNENCRTLFAEYLLCRKNQFDETLTPITISASIAFINAEPNPEEVIVRSINRPQRCFKHFFPTDPAIRQAYKKKLKTDERYAVRTSRKKRAKCTEVTDTVFVPRTIFQKMGIEL